MAPKGEFSLKLSLIKFSEASLGFSTVALFRSEMKRNFKEKTPYNIIAKTNSFWNSGVAHQLQLKHKQCREQ